MSESYQSTAEQLLAVAGDQRGATPAEMSARAVRVVDQLVHHLSPLIGDLGVRTLLARSAAVSSVRFPWLANAIPNARDHPRWELLSAAVEQQEATAARDGVVLLLSTFVALLARLIGEALVRVHLHELWPEVFPGAGEETT